MEKLKNCCFNLLKSKNHTVKILLQVKLLNLQCYLNKSVNNISKIFSEYLKFSCSSNKNEFNQETEKKHFCAFIVQSHCLQEVCRVYGFSFLKVTKQDI